ncbi:hypothetical protein VPHD529_0007 [Vibrio phage D529]
MCHVTWCVLKLRDALLSGDSEAADNYLAMSKMWASRYKEETVGYQKVQRFLQP